jgi:dTDP-4-amino-4,6-dideoxygalactose transaminase
MTGCGGSDTLKDVHMDKKDIRIPFNKPFIVGKELYYISQAVIEGQLAGDGPFTKRCHTWLEEHIGCRKALLTHSCTAALEMAAMLCDIQLGDEVIMPSFTFVSTANAFVLRGAVPVFVDIRQDTLNIDEKLIEEAMSAKTRAIVPVHYAGVPCAMDEILALAEKHGVYVIEDAAQALLSMHKNKFLGTLGHFGCLSFHETKNIISGEGGALLVNKDTMCERAEILREKGTNRSQFFRGEVDKYTWVDIGSSYLPSELVSAFLFAQMEMADRIVESRREIFYLYLELLKPLEEKGMLRLPFVDDRDSNNGHIFYVIASCLEKRDHLIGHLAKSGIKAIFHYVPLHSSPAGKRYGRVSGSMRLTDDLSDRLLRLPLYYGMSHDDVYAVVDCIKDFFGV